MATYSRWSSIHTSCRPSGAVDLLHASVFLVIAWRWSGRTVCIRKRPSAMQRSESGKLWQRQGSSDVRHRTCFLALVFDLVRLVLFQDLVAMSRHASSGLGACMYSMCCLTRPKQMQRLATGSLILNDVLSALSKTVQEGANATRLFPCEPTGKHSFLAKHDLF